MKVGLQPKVALVHDYLREYGGAEKVLEVLHELYPQAPILTAYYNPQAMGSHAARFKGWDIRTSWLQKLPAANKLISAFRIFAPMMFEGFDLKEYDLVISSCNIYFAKAVITRPSALHLSYIHTPPRFLYGYTTSFNYKKHWWTRLGGEIINHILRVYDFETSQRPDALIANSKNVAARIKKFYRREAVVIYPPVDVDPDLIGVDIKVKKTKGEYFLALNRLVRGKGTEVAVAACAKLNLPLKVAGSGPELENLKKLSGKDIEFLGEVSDSEREKLYSGAKALIVCSEDEDFGITSVEAQAGGTPVITAGAGGYLETVIPGKTGEFYTPGKAGYLDKESVENLSEVLKSFDPEKYKVEDCIKNAQKFSKENFKKQILDLVDKNLAEK